MTTLDHSQIERLVPHAGDMCLLTAVNSWDEQRINCSGREAGARHPLAREQDVPAIAACEYAAQAAAVHGALLDGSGRARPGMLAKIMEVQLHAPRFQGGCEVIVRAELLSRVDTGCLYAFDIEGGRQQVASGRLMVSFAQTETA